MYQRQQHADLCRCIIVDSTRRGKSMPDALSKTIPVWITVMNRFLFPDITAHHALRTPDTVVPPSEHSQMEARIDGFVEQFKVGIFLKFCIHHLTLQVPQPRPLAYRRGAFVASGADLGNTRPTPPGLRMASRPHPSLPLYSITPRAWRRRQRERLHPRRRRRSRELGPRTDRRALLEAQRATTEHRRGRFTIFDRFNCPEPLCRTHAEHARQAHDTAVRLDHRRSCRLAGRRHSADHRLAAST